MIEGPPRVAGLTSEFSVVLNPDVEFAVAIAEARELLDERSWREDDAHLTICGGIHTCRPVSDAEILRRVLPIAHETLDEPITVVSRGVEDWADPRYDYSSIVGVEQTPQLTGLYRSFYQRLTAANFHIDGREKAHGLYPHVPIGLGVRLPADPDRRQQLNELFPAGEPIHFVASSVLRIYTEEVSDTLFDETLVSKQRQAYRLALTNLPLDLAV